MPPTRAIAVTRTSPHCSGNTAGRRGANVRRLTRFHIRANSKVMQDAFWVVLVVVVVGASIVAVITFALSDKTYAQIGRGGLSLRDGSDRPLAEPLSGAAFESVRDDEIRQMLEARNERRLRRGQEPLDIETELATLVRPDPAALAADPALVAEVRDLVMARNERRVRQGKEPLDVDAEVARQLRDLG
jgi:hypothetical protein